MRLLPSVAAAAFLLCSPAFASSITYTVNENFPAFTAQGTITTDGTLGTLTTANILSFDLSLTISFVSASFTNGGSFIAQIEGTDVTATASGLFYDFGGPVSFFNLGSSTDETFLCFGNAGGCAGSGGMTAVTASIAGLVGLSPTQSGEVQIAAVTAVPEPPTLALLGSGLFGVAAVLRKRLV